MKSIFDGIEKAGRGPKATQKQLDYIESLCEQTGCYEVELEYGRMVEPMKELYELTVGEASEIIEILKEERYEASWEYDDPDWWRD